MMGKKGDTPQEPEAVLSNRLNMENKGQRDRGSDPKVCGLGEKQQTGF